MATATATTRASPLPNASALRITRAPPLSAAAAPYFPAGWRSGIERAYAPRDRRPQLPPPRRQRQYDLFVDGVLVSTGFVDPPSFPAPVSPSRTNREPEACRVCLDDVIPHNIEAKCIVKWLQRNRCPFCRTAPIID
ncbi:unnamed protein product [Cuscuta epithymum]|uniref:RING-type domain-containing protein n=1 Tax=Cuscuta epithymum TaxID=186058 RepID=A0AAV0CLU9_9ASTE|nr:unnamed protein product [Cuscuta epithymum]